jgi:hypothetical protein
MLGLEGMAVMAVSERDGELEYAIETTATAGWCPVVWSAGQACIIAVRPGFAIRPPEAAQ